jgi:molybdate transport system ATP-binding protein
MALRIDYDHSLRTFDAHVELTVDAGETLALVGPSGAGKTTTLQVVAGLLRPDRGMVSVDGDTWLDTSVGLDRPAERRRVGYLFQEYALFPHLDVAANVRFGAPRGAAIGELLERFRIDGLQGARVRELSGGERQRVALARALARRPAALLLDEPLSALDAHTRTTVRAELHELLRELGLPTILVTHDFEDAAALADRVGVIVAGRIVQQGPAAGLVAEPGDAFVASLTGASLLPGVARAGQNGLTEVVLDAGGSAWSTDRATGRVGVAIHAWEVALARETPDDSALNHLRGTITSIVPLGNRARVRVGDLVAEISAASLERLALREGEPVVASFKATAARLLPLA